MAKLIERFWGGEDGNATIDWMVLTAGLVLLGAAVVASVGPTPQALANDATAVIDAIDTGA
jgi:hypothetical protein